MKNSHHLQLSEENCYDALMKNIPAKMLASFGPLTKRSSFYNGNN